MFKFLPLIITLALSATMFAATAKKIPGEFIVKLRNGANARQVFSGAMAKSLFAKKSGLKGTNGRFVRVKMKPGSSVAGLRAFNNSPAVQYIEPNYRLTIPKYKVHSKTFNTKMPSDKMYSKLWGLNNTKSGFDVDAPEAWKFTKGSKKVIVAVIDTGVDYKHPDLVQNIWVNSAEKNGKPGVDDDNNGYVDDIYGYDFANHDSDPMDDQGHGTHCAGTIGAVHNSIGVAGVTANVQIMGVKFLGQRGGSTAGAIESIYYAAANGAHIMSNSWGGGGFSKALKDAIEYANAKGIIFTAAAGNSNENNDVGAHFPSNYEVDNVISVAAYAEDGERAYVMRKDPKSGKMKKIVFSNYGQKTVDVSAPGSEIVSTIPNGGYAAYSGTSMATPHVTGVIALLLSTNTHGLLGKRGAFKVLNLSPKKVKELLIKTSVKAPSLNKMTVSNGRVSAARVLSVAIKAQRN